MLEFERHNSSILLNTPSSPSIFSLPSPITEVQLPLLRQKGLQLLVKRDDLIHPEISGNKWRKLRLNLEAAHSQQSTAIVTFGGAFSNHILAVAAAGSHFQMNTHGIIRGDVTAGENDTLQRAKAFGMKLHFVNRTAYRDKVQVIKEMGFGDEAYIIPEGGSNALGVEGCTDIVNEVNKQLGQIPEYWSCSVGSGGTIAGLILGLSGKAGITGFSSLKGNFLTEEVEKLLEQVNGKAFRNWSISTEYHFGGYAKWQSELINFINSFKKDTGLALDPIYTGKLFYGILDLVKKDYYPRGSQILVLHTGGLQGISGFNKRFGNLLK